MNDADHGLIQKIRTTLEADKSDPISIVLARKDASWLVDCLLFATEIAEMNDCNNCADKMECPYRPRWGENVRFNCPLWKEAAT